ncbi:OsmC family protein [Pseudomonas xanthosomatis]|uniref:OsmC family protein n=1 Tax=Pseudomonas xanthosomatis TaxID=2842356 RepID=UPI001C3E036D|nr:OsmC family protein [Pseudomonas xanthosomatis]QXH45908.1 OsmC family protein [Pseudomonas xanthosomatis]
MKEHHYALTLNWTGNTGQGTSSYTAYQRDYTLEITGKPSLHGSADPAFRGDPARWNPEDMLLASLSACHKLWYLHLCAVNKVNVLAYVDHPEGRMVEGDAERKGHFTEVVLRPQVVVSSDSDAQMALRLHEDAHHECFVANSVNFPVRCEAVIRREG